MCGMMMWDGKQSKHIFQLLFKHSVTLSLVGHISRMPDVKVKTEFPDIPLFSRKWEPCQHHN